MHYFLPEFPWVNSCQGIGCLKVRCRLFSPVVTVATGCTLQRAKHAQSAESIPVIDHLVLSPAIIAEGGDGVRIFAQLTSQNRVMMTGPIALTLHNGPLLLQARLCQLQFKPPLPATGP